MLRWIANLARTHPSAGFFTVPTRRRARSPAGQKVPKRARLSEVGPLSRYNRPRLNADPDAPESTRVVLHCVTHVTGDRTGWRRTRHGGGAGTILHCNHHAPINKRRQSKSKTSTSHARERCLAVAAVAAAVFRAVYQNVFETATQRAWIL